MAAAAAEEEEEAGSAAMAMGVVRLAAAAADETDAAVGGMASGPSEARTAAEAATYGQRRWTPTPMIATPTAVATRTTSVAAWEAKRGG